MSKEDDASEESPYIQDAKAEYAGPAPIMLFHSRIEKEGIFLNAPQSRTY
jgi:hypothetical protein